MSSKPTKRTVLTKLEKPVIYMSSTYGYSGRLTGKGVSIAIVDSGAPSHPDLKKPEDVADFSEDMSGAQDQQGHATSIAGIIGGKQTASVRGVAPDAPLYHAKAMDAKGECSFNSLVGSILWATAKQVDIILVALGTTAEYNLLHDAVIKAYKSGICLVAAAGNHMKKATDEPDFPARYDEVLSVCSLPEGRKRHRKDIINNRIQLAVPTQPCYSTYLEGMYTTVSGSSVASAYVAGLMALEIEKRRQEGKSMKPNDVYTSLVSTNIKSIK
tara:strand:+ start:243 stop:1055 length:813 start_codon:yes stop_codon:yes gene_type:complete